MNNTTGFRSMMIDAILFVFLSTLPVIVAMFASDEAAKYLSPEALFWIKNGLGALGAAIGSIKCFRSLSFANHLNQKNIDEGKESIFTQQPKPSVVIVEAQKDK